jgi:hypothetical protein
VALDPNTLDNLKEVRSLLLELLAAKLRVKVIHALA